MLDSIVLINDRNETLWVRSGGHALSDAYKALLALQNEHASLTLIRSHTNQEGDEVFTEVATPLAKAAYESDLPVQAVIVEIWHRTPPVFFITEEDADTLKDVADQFVLAGRIAVAVQGKAEGSAEAAEELYEDWLETAYRFSQNIESNWNPANPSRSSSTGDVFRFSYEAGPAPQALHPSPEAHHPAPQAHHLSPQARSFAVMNVGFKEIAFEPVAPEAQKAARRRPG